MRIGVVSDSHDNLPAIEAALKAFAERGLQHILHAGDIVAPFAAKAWRKFPGRITAVFGNNDGEKKGLRDVLDDIHRAPHSLTLGGKRIVLAHDVEKVTPALAKKAELIIFGHSHHPEERREGTVLWLNPGETGGWLTGARTCAVVDLETLSVEMIHL